MAALEALASQFDPAGIMHPGALLGSASGGEAR
jgi:FAD/FMN-containing dehydrogenase